MNVKNLLIILAIINLTGCSWVKPVTLKTEPIKKVKLDIKKIPYISFKKIRWVVITPENSKKIFKKLQSEKTNLAIFGLTAENYENLSLNLSEFRKYIVEQNAIINAYKNYYENSPEQK